jgi:hypothetical protein
MKTRPASTQAWAKAAFSLRKAVAGVNGVGAGLAGGVQQGVDAQVGLRGGAGADAHGLVGQRHMGCLGGRRR